MAKTTSQLRAAMREHRSGNLKGAATAYKRILHREPLNADALHLLGVVLAEAGELEPAAACVVQAIRSGGPQAAYCANLGRILMWQHKPGEAVACFRQALSAAPLDIDITFQLAKAFTAVQRLDDARVAFEQTIALDPDFGEAHFNLGVLLLIANRTADARACFSKAVQLNPGDIDARNNLAILLHSEGRWQEAEECYRQALAIRPSDSRTQYNLGRLYEDQNDPARAKSVYENLLAREPRHVEGRTNLGNCLLNLARPNEAAAELRKALAVSPDYVDAHWNLAMALLSVGDFSRGWREYEWRFRQCPGLERGFDRPRWDGGELGGRRILLHAEQGVGDTVQFVRYARLVKARGGHVILECPAPLVRLLSSIEGVDEIAARGDTLPDFDCHAPLLSLPGVVGTSLESIPHDVPYLSAAGELAARWSRRMRAPDHSLRVGVSWAGNPGHRNDRNRSLAAGWLASLDGIAETTFFNLQTGEAGMAEDLRPAMVPIAAELGDFADTAAAMQHLDLIISVDTSVAHLAGALARPVWTLLPYAADWRWLEDRNDSPWYPTMRLFRQTSAGDWNGVMDRVRTELEMITTGAGTS